MLAKHRTSEHNRYGASKVINYLKFSKNYDIIIIENEKEIKKHLDNFIKNILYPCAEGLTTLAWVRRNCLVVVIGIP